MHRLPFLVFVLIIWACTARESGEIQESNLSEEAVRDSMPVVEPELPETANVIVPQVQDSMPVVEPESIQVPD